MEIITSWSNGAGDKEEKSIISTGQDGLRCVSEGEREITPNGGKTTVEGLLTEFNVLGLAEGDVIMSLLLHLIHFHRRIP